MTATDTPLPFPYPPGHVVDNDGVSSTMVKLRADHYLALDNDPVYKHLLGHANVCDRCGRNRDRTTGNLTLTLTLCKQTCDTRHRPQTRVLRRLVPTDLIPLLALEGAL